MREPRRGADDDLLIGTNGPNQLLGGETTMQTGNDTLVGLGGNDTLGGALGDSNTVSYAQGSTGPIALSLETTAPQATGGSGTDTITDTTLDGDALPDIQNIVGSPFADTLTGNSLANRIVGRGGRDEISLLDGPDRFEVLDGVLDTVACGGGADSGVADEPGVDAINPDCETTDFAPQTSVGGGPVDGALTNDPTPTYQVSANEPATFRYRVDGGAFRACPASCAIAALPDGAHTLAFRATDTDAPAPTTDQTPATRDLEVDARAPLTTIDDGPKRKTRKRKTTIVFSSTEVGSSFECALDQEPFAACESPFRERVKRRRHSFEVRSTDEAGNTDPTPALHEWKVKKKRKG
ncbi:MAG: hypothetical protein ACRDMA_11025 [Solirubrobacterales bacterium]